MIKWFKTRYYAGLIATLYEKLPVSEPYFIREYDYVMDTLKDKTDSRIAWARATYECLCQFPRHRHAARMYSQ